MRIAQGNHMGGWRATPRVPTNGAHACDRLDTASTCTKFTIDFNELN